MKIKNNMLFVYGTLKRGCPNHVVLEEIGAEFVCCVTTVEKYPLRVRHLPLLYDTPGTGHHVKGELYCLPRQGSFQRLDALEGHPTFYKRRGIEVRDQVGNVVKVRVYFFQCEFSHLDGDEMVEEYVGHRVR